MDAVFDKIKPRLPALPGCYLFKDESDKVLYVGKAKNIKSRVSSYFKGKNLSPKTELLVSKIQDAEFIVTDNEVEALVLENNLIKRHQPPYNIDLKSNVRYAYISITNEKWPRIITVRKKAQGKHSKNKIWGPYTDGWLRVQLIKLCIDVFKIRICRTLPKKPCLQYHIGKCDAPCINNITHEAYMKNVKGACDLLDGKTEKLSKELRVEMERFSKAQEYEKAKEKRDQLALLEQVVQHQKVETAREFDQDIIASVREEHKLKVIVFQIKRGVIAKRESFTIEEIGSKIEGSAISEFVRAYYTSRTPPKEIIIDESPDDKKALEEFYSKQTGRKTEIIIPVRGERKALLELARQNAAVELQQSEPELAELARVLKMRALPSIIECFDISNLGSHDVVAASVQYLNGKPNPSEYRKYEIRTVEGQDDFRSMYEAVFRRYRRLREEGKTLPDLVVIDGGKQQLAFARKALADAQVNIPIIALAKRDEEVYLPYLSVPLRLPRNNAALKLLQRVRDSTHRFVLSYQKNKRSKRMLQ